LSLQDQLRELYRLDMQVRGMRGRLDAALRRHDLQKQKLDQLNQQARELADHLRHTQARQHEREQQAQEKQQQIDRHREQMNTITSNKQYSAMLVENNNLKNEKSKLEDQALELMNEIEAIKERQTNLQQKLEEQQKLVEQSESEITSAREEVGGRLEELETERDQALEALPTEARYAFQRLADAYEGEAMAEVEEEDRRRKEFSCGGCFISLPREHVNAAAGKPDQMTVCPNCGRILYVNEELKAAIKPGS
jgi:predicted  nucleic acid-binding Zn-ribbon protein